MFRKQLPLFLNELFLPQFWAQKFECFVFKLSSENFPHYSKKNRLLEVSMTDNGQHIMTPNQGLGSMDETTPFQCTKNQLIHVINAMHYFNTEAKPISEFFSTWTNNAIPWKPNNSEFCRAINFKIIPAYLVNKIMGLWIKSKEGSSTSSIIIF